MAVSNKAVDKQSLKGLSPLGKLSPDKIDDIISKSRVENIPAGRTIFRQGDSNDQKIYLLSGQIELATPGKTRKKIIKSKSVEAKFPVADEIPRKVTAKTKTASSLLYIDSSLLEILLDDNPSGEYEVTEINIAEHATDWMMRFLQSRAFLKLPTENIQKVLMCMEEIHAQKDEIIINQNQTGDYYYIIKKGQCAVFRRPAEKLDEVRLALLAEGDGFGEEALITNQKRNASIRMLEDGTLMRLKKDDFLNLLVKPLIRNIHLNSLKNTLYKNYLVIDIRNNDDFKAGSLDNAKHIPLSMLRLRIPTLDTSRQYLIYADSKDDAGAAAFLLAQHGIESHVILGLLKDQTKTAVVKNNPGPDRLDLVKTGEAGEPANSEVHPTADISTNSATQNNQRTKQETTAPDTSNQIIKIEQLQREAKEQAKKMLSEAEAIRQSAVQEASMLKIKLKQEETNRLKGELENTRSKAEAAIQKSEQLAKQIRKQAEQEGSQIRKQAVAEVEKLRVEIEQLRREEAEMKQHLESEVLQIRQKTVSEAQKEAEHEANKARLAAEEAAKVVKKMAMQEAEKTRTRAQKEAEQARQAAIKDAESTLAAAEHAAIEAQARAEKLTTAAENLELERANSLKKAEQEAIAIRKAALEEAEKIKQMALEESNKLKEQNNLIPNSIINHDNIFDLDEEPTPPIEQAAMPFADEGSMALEMAKEIREKLLEVEEQRRENEKQCLANPNKQEVTVRKTKGKTALETDTELFVFKEPNEKKTFAKTFNDHISTGVFNTGADKESSTVDVTESQIIFPSDTNNMQDNFNATNIVPLYEQQESYTKKRSIFALAASILLVIALSLIAYTTKIQINFTEVGALVNHESIENKEDKARTLARKEFRKKLSSIRK